MNETDFDLTEVFRLQTEWTKQWHDSPTPTLEGIPWSFVEYNHRMNFQLWHEEDVARRDDLGSERVRQAKRIIDVCNQSRNDAVEQVDRWLLEHLPPPNVLSPQHSETPGMIMDRLSILSLKLYHMQIEVDRASGTEEHRTGCRLKCGVLEEQACDLQRCLTQLLKELALGTRRFKLYRQMKMYNDPSLNPQLYTKSATE